MDSDLDIQEATKLTTSADPDAIVKEKSTHGGCDASRFPSESSPVIEEVKEDQGLTSAMDNTLEAKDMTKVSPHLSPKQVVYLTVTNAFFVQRSFQVLE